MTNKQTSSFCFGECNLQRVYTKRRCLSFFLQNQAHLPLCPLGLLLRSLVQNKSDRVIEDFLHAFAGHGRALDVTAGAHLLCHLLACGRSHGLQASHLESVCDVRVVSQVLLGADENERHTGSVVLDLGNPFGLDVQKRRGGGEGEADEEDVGLGVGQGSETVVVFLTGGIPQAQVDGLAVHHHVG